MFIGIGVAQLPSVIMAIVQKQLASEPFENVDGNPKKGIGSLSV